MNVRRRVWSGLVVLILALSIVGAPGSHATGASRADVLIIAKDISDIRTPDPNKSYDVSGVFLQFPIYSRLVKQVAPDFWKIQPDLAESWTVSPDATTYTFKLRKGAVFSGGNPVTSEDVRFSLLRTRNIKGYGSFLADSIKAVDVVDPQTVRVTLSGPDATFLAAVGAGVFSIVDSKTVRAHGGVETPGADTLDKAEQWFYTNSAGAGPYVLQRYTRETEIVLERNDKYYGTHPFFREVIIRHVKDPSTQALMLQRNDVDLALDLNADQADSLKGKPGVALLEDPSAYTVYLGLNSSAHPWDNPKVREAVKYSIDYNGIVSGIMHGHGQRIGSIMMPGMLGFPDSLNKQLLYAHNPAKAASLMKEAGVSRASVTLTWASGTNYGALPLDRLAQKLRADLATIGIDLRLQPVQQSIFLTYYRQGKPETAIGFWFPDYMDPDNWSYFVSGFINKRLHWQNPEAAALVKAAAQTPDQQKRGTMYEQYNRMLAAPGSPYVFLAQPTAITAARDDITQFKFHPLYFLQIESLGRK
ncbi:MAG TPA: ABC transporter substrate-binding protein [bacterium]|nr:ABC transporter substrate-binding protein [bacterium]